MSRTAGDSPASAPTGGSGDDGLVGPVPQGVTRLVLGLADLASQAVSAARPGTPRPVGAPAPLGDALLGFALEVERQSVSRVVGTADRAGRWARAATRLLVPSAVRGAADRRIAYWSARGAAERERSRNQAGDLARALVRAVTAAVVDELDLDAVADRLDVDRVARRVDLDALLARVDLDAVLARMDLDAVLARVDVDALLARIDLDAAIDRIDVDAVAERLDVDRVARRIDLDALLARVDLATYTEQVLEELDVGRIVRDTGGSMTAETLDAFREQNARADRFVDRFTDRLLHRAGSPPGPSAGEPRPGGGREGPEVP